MHRLDLALHFSGGPFEHGTSLDQCSVVWPPFKLHWHISVTPLFNQPDATCMSGSCQALTVVGFQAQHFLRLSHQAVIFPDCRK